MLPSVAFHVTVLSKVAPCTLAVKGSVPSVMDAADAGDMVTELTAGPDGADATVIVAEPDLLGSALLTAVTVAITAFAGAV
jgi:hypothetical protein